MTYEVGLPVWRRMLSCCKVLWEDPVFGYWWLWLNVVTSYCNELRQSINQRWSVLLLTLPSLTHHVRALIYDRLTLPPSKELEKIGNRYSRIASGLIHTTDICAVILPGSAGGVDLLEYLTVEPTPVVPQPHRILLLLFTVDNSFNKSWNLPMTFQRADWMDQFSRKLNQFSN